MKTQNQPDAAAWHNLTLAVELIPTGQLLPPEREARKHPAKQISRIARAIQSYGLTRPITVDGESRVVDGWATVQAAESLGYAQLSCIRLTHLSTAQVKGLRLALNRIPEDANWDPTELTLEFGAIMELESDFDLTLTGFEPGEIDVSLLGTADPPPETAPPNPDRNERAVTRIGDQFMLGDHRLHCGDARDTTAYDALLQGKHAAMVMQDVPFNLPIANNVSGKGQHQHGEFVMGSGEMTDEEFLQFLILVFTTLRSQLIDGGLCYTFIDWRSVDRLITAGRQVFDDLINICVWTKPNGGMGSLYRSQHELVVIFKVGRSTPVNNVQLGKFGRNRTNVWSYPGVSSFGPGRDEALAMHPTVKPMALVRDAILDVTHRGDAVLDPFLGSGTTLIACEEIGRRGFGMELDPHYCDVAIRRWQTHTGQAAIHAETGLAFDELKQVRQREEDADVQEI